MLNTKKKGTSKPTSEKSDSKAKTTEKAAPAAKKQNKYDKAISEQKAIIEAARAEIIRLTAAKVNDTDTEWKVGMDVYYPAPPQKNVIKCTLEVMPDENGEAIYFVRPVCVDKNGNEVPSKRHYVIGPDPSECKELYKTMPKSAAKSSTNKSATKKGEVTATKPKKDAPAKTEKSSAPAKKKMLIKKK